MHFAKVAVVGVGLIGGSFALALKAARACGDVVGVGRGAANLKLALEQGVIDAVGADIADITGKRFGKSIAFVWV